MLGSIKKTIRVKESLFVQTKEIADKMGLSYQDYIQYLLAEDLRRVNCYNPLELKREDKQNYFAEMYINNLKIRELRAEQNRGLKNYDEYDS